MIRKLLSGIFIFVLIVPSSSAQGKLFDLKNQISSRVGINFGDPVQSYLGARFVPTLSISGDLKKERLLDAEISVNTYGNIYYADCKFDESDFSIKPYRFWIRYSTPRVEIRLGLQKISFGSASILRPLMWFDKMDFRDPLQITDGVYALLGRYYFQNNANIWLWSLYGNNDPKGWETVPTYKYEPEFGGRLQIPVYPGEIALSYHHRKADYTSVYSMTPSVTSPFFSEDMLGFDTKWDIGPGVCFEYTWKRNDKDNILVSRDEHYLNIGFDYTFSIGNGLNITAEYFNYKGNVNNNYTALALNYPFGLMNRIIGAVYYNWDMEEWYRFINIQRDFDYWSLNFIAFWNPENTALYITSEGRNIMAGKGLQFMATVNF